VKKLLFSFMLMIAFSVPFTIQAEIITAPIYKIDVTQPAEGIGLTKFVVAVDTANHNTKLKSFNMCTEMTKPDKTVININQCAACYSNATGYIGVSGGDSIGIRQFS